MIGFLHRTSLVVIPRPQQRRFIPIVLAYRAGERFYQGRVLGIQLGDEVIRCRWFVQVAEVVEGVSCTALGKSWYFDPVETMDVGIHPVGSDQAGVFVATELGDCYRNTFRFRRPHLPFHSESWLCVTATRPCPGTRFVDSWGHPQRYQLHGCQRWGFERLCIHLGSP